MASPYFVSIKLEPHYQRFLRSHFKCESEIFEFPQRHQFNTMLEHFVTTRPYGNIDHEPNEWLFKIAIPYFEYKNAAHFRYLTNAKEAIFKAKIKEFYDWIIQERIRELMRNTSKKEPGATALTLNRQQCTMILIDEYGFDSCNNDSFERLYKLFTRNRKSELDKRYRLDKKKTKLIVNKC